MAKKKPNRRRIEYRVHLEPVKVSWSINQGNGVVWSQDRMQLPAMSFDVFDSLIDLPVAALSAVAEYIRDWLDDLTLMLAAVLWLYRDLRKVTSTLRFSFLMLTWIFRPRMEETWTNQRRN